MDFYRKIDALYYKIEILFWKMNGWLGYVVHSVYITIGPFKIYYRIKLLDNMDNIVTVMGKTWWTHLENSMVLWFLVINAFNLNIEWIDDKNIRKLNLINNLNLQWRKSWQQIRWTMIPNTGFLSELQPTQKLRSIVRSKLKCCQENK